MSPEETHEALRETMESTIAFLGDSTGWSQYYENPPEQFTLPDGTYGVNYVALQTGPGVADAEATVTALEAHWISLGIAPQRVDSPREQIVLFGYGGPVKGIVLYADVNQTVLEMGRSRRRVQRRRCVRPVRIAGRAHRRSPRRHRQPRRDRVRRPRSSQPDLARRPDRGDRSGRRTC